MQRFATYLFLLTGALVLRTPWAHGQNCPGAPTQCDPRTRDARGCCPSAAATPPASACPAGMVPIPGGEFSMGSPRGEGDPDEFPPIRVRVSPYCMDRTEVTVASYRRCVQAGACPTPPTTAEWNGITPEEHRLWDQFCNGLRTDRDNHPANCVGWNHADAYCRWSGGRLATEPEWEFAARGTDARRFPWGNALPDATRLNGCGTECAALLGRFGRSVPTMYNADDHWDATSPAGSYPAGASPYGVLDMSGNVWEWLADVYVRQRRQTSPVLVDPVGPPTGRARMIRGGSWHTLEAAGVRAAYRSAAAPTRQDAGIGIRCVRSQQAPRTTP